MKLLIVIDMQNDFIDGSLGSKEAVNIVGNVKAKIGKYKKEGNQVLFTLDTHYEDYLTTTEGKNLPVMHCVKGTNGHNVSSHLDTTDCMMIEKNTFGTLELRKYIDTKAILEVELCGLCTDICVVSNAIILKTQFPDMRITVDSSCCAGVSLSTHNYALEVMKMCQINVI